MSSGTFPVTVSRSEPSAPAAGPTRASHLSVSVSCPLLVSFMPGAPPLGPHQPRRPREAPLFLPGKEVPATVRPGHHSGAAGCSPSPGPENAVREAGARTRGHGARVRATSRPLPSGAGGVDSTSSRRLAPPTEGRAVGGGGRPREASYFRTGGHFVTVRRQMGLALGFLCPSGTQRAFRGMKAGRR